MRLSFGGGADARAATVRPAEHACDVFLVQRSGAGPVEAVRPHIERMSVNEADRFYARILQVPGPIEMDLPGATWTRLGDFSRRHRRSHTLVAQAAAEQPTCPEKFCEAITLARLAGANDSARDYIEKALVGLDIETSLHDACHAGQHMRTLGQMYDESPALVAHASPALFARAGDTLRRLREMHTHKPSAMLEACIAATHHVVQCSATRPAARELGAHPSAATTPVLVAPGGAPARHGASPTSRPADGGERPKLARTPACNLTSDSVWPGARPKPAARPETDGGLYSAFLAKQCTRATAGLDALTDADPQLRAYVARMVRVELTERFGAPLPCLLLQGSPGCGKTLSVAALAHDLNADLWIHPAGLDKMQGESARKLADMFAMCRQHVATARGRVVLFIDEADQLIGARSERLARGFGAGDDVDMTNTFLAETGRDAMLTRNRGITVILATNFLQHIDDGVLDRFQLISMEPPTRAALHTRMRTLLGGLIDVSDADLEIYLDAVAGADSFRLLDRAREAAINFAVAAGRQRLVFGDLVSGYNALCEVRTGRVARIFDSNKRTTGE